MPPGSAENAAFALLTAFCAALPAFATILAPHAVTLNRAFVRHSPIAPGILARAFVRPWIRKLPCSSMTADGDAIPNSDLKPFRIDSPTPLIASTAAPASPLIPDIRPSIRNIPTPNQSIPFNRLTAFVPIVCRSVGIALISPVMPFTISCIIPLPRLAHPKFDTILLALLQNSENILGMAVERALMPLPIAVTIVFPRLSQLKAISTETIAWMICGIFCAITGMADIIPPASFPMICTPHDKIFGALSLISPAMFVTIVGTVRTNTGIFAIRESARAITSSRPASTIFPTLALSAPVNVISAFIATGIISGSLDRIPSARLRMIPTAASVTLGMPSMIPDAILTAISAPILTASCASPEKPPLSRALCIRPIASFPISRAFLKSPATAFSAVTDRFFKDVCSWLVLNSTVSLTFS